MGFEHRYTIQSPDVLIYRNSKRVYDGPVTLDLQNDMRKPGRYTLTNLSISCSVETSPNTCTLTFALPTDVMGHAKGAFFDPNSVNTSWAVMDHIQVFVSTHIPSQTELNQEINNFMPLQDKGNYIMLFAGVVTDVTTTVELEKISMTVNALDYLYWLTITKLNIKWSGVEMYLRGQEIDDEVAKYTLFNNKYIGQRLKTFIYQILFNREESQLTAIPEFDLFTVWYSSLNKGQFLNLHTLISKYKDSGTKKKYDMLAESMTKDTPSISENLPNNLIEKNSIEKDPLAISIDQITRVDENKNPLLTQQDVFTTLLSQKVNQRALGLYWDFQFQSFMRENFVSFFRGHDAEIVPILWDGSGSGDMFFSMEGTYTTRIEMLKEVLSLLLYEFYQTPQGLFILKPPLYNAPPSFSIDSVEIESISHKVDANSILTSVTTEGILAVGGAGKDRFDSEIQLNTNFPFIQGSYTCLFPKTWKPSIKEGDVESIGIEMTMSSIQDFDIYVEDIEKIIKNYKNAEEVAKNTLDSLNMTLAKNPKEKGKIEILRAKLKKAEKDVENAKIFSKIKITAVYNIGDGKIRKELIYGYPSSPNRNLFKKLMIFNYFYRNYQLVLGMGNFSKEKFNEYMKNINKGLSLLSYKSETELKFLESLHKKLQDEFSLFLFKNEKNNTPILVEELTNKEAEVFENFWNNLPENIPVAKKEKGKSKKNKEFEFIVSSPSSISAVTPNENLQINTPIMSSINIQGPPISEKDEEKQAKQLRKEKEEQLKGQGVQMPIVKLVISGLYNATDKELKTSQGRWNVLEHGQRSIKLTNRLVRTQDQAIAYSKFYLYINNAKAETVNVTLKTLRPDIIPGFTLLNKMDMCVYYVTNVSYTITPGSSISTNLTLIARRPPIWVNRNISSIDYSEPNNYLKVLSNPYDYRNNGIVPSSDLNEGLVSFADVDFFGWEFYGPTDSFDPNSPKGGLDANGIFLPPFGGHLCSAINFEKKEHVTNIGLGLSKTNKKEAILLNTLVYKITVDPIKNIAEYSEFLPGKGWTLSDTKHPFAKLFDYGVYTEFVDYSVYIPEPSIYVTYPFNVDAILLVREADVEMDKILSNKNWSIKLRSFTPIEGTDWEAIQNRIKLTAYAYLAPKITGLLVQLHKKGLKKANILLNKK